MISFHRRRERVPFLSPAPLRDLAGIRSFHASLRQGLYRFLTEGSSRSRWRRALLPDYVPEGVHAPLKDAGLDIAFYPVGLDLSVDAAALKAARIAQDSDVIVYIHHFGLYREDNLAAVRAALAPGVLFIEDFAMTLPNAGMEMAGDLALFSFTKMLGVTDGGMVWFRDRDLLDPAESDAADAKAAADTRAAAGKGGGGAGAAPAAKGIAGPGDDPARILVERMESNLAFEDWIQRWRPRPAVQTLVRRLLGKRIGYYAQLTRHYREIGAPVTEASRRLLEAVDFEAVLARRREIARLYLAGLDARFQLGTPAEAYLRNALMAFPIMVDNQDRFHAHLAKRGVLGFRLTDCWWFKEGAGRSELFRRHYLLPATHYLEDREVRAVIACVNAYPA